MGRFFGKVGYVETTETTPGVWKETVTERDYYGDEVKLSRRISGADINDNVNVAGNEISIIADPYALEHFHNIRYVVWSNVKWKITMITVNRPRLMLRLGGVYNGDTGPTA